MAPVGQAQVVALLQQVAHLQPGLVLGGVGQHAALARGVVQHQLVVPAAARLLASRLWLLKPLRRGGVGVAFVGTLAFALPGNQAGALPVACRPGVDAVACASGWPSPL
jgi:hypothetical protein